MIMQYKNIGGSGLKVSRMCLGTMMLGIVTDETESIKMIKSSLAAGINFIDTSASYGRGMSEEIIGKAIKGDRHSYIIATKVNGLSSNNMMKAVDDSLRRLQTDYIDLYYAHYPDYNTPIEETLRAFDDMVHQGKVRYIGCSNFTVWQLCKALRMSDIHNLARFICIEPPYNLLSRDIEFELLGCCADEKIGICTYSPMASDFLSGKYEFNKPPEGLVLGSPGMGLYWSEINFKAVDQFKKIAQEHGRSMSHLCLSWVLNHEEITSVISAPISTQQLEENLPAVDIELSKEELEAIDEVWGWFRPPRYFYARDNRIRTDSWDASRPGFKPPG
jgi:aryl-alcohol dehydrogenase-like predicted oxidoreductase